MLFAQRPFSVGNYFAPGGKKESPHHFKSVNVFSNPLFVFWESQLKGSKNSWSDHQNFFIYIMVQRVEMLIRFSLFKSFSTSGRSTRETLARPQALKSTMSALQFAGRKILLRYFNQFMGNFPGSGIRNKQVSDIESGYPDIESGYPDIRI